MQVVTALFGIAMGLARALAGQTSNCGPFDAVSEVLKHRVVVIGELHGTNEIPAAVGEYVCRLLSNGEAITVGLELPAREQAALDVFLASSGSAADVAQLVSSDFWKVYPPFGMSSKAILGLIVRLRLLRSEGHDVRILAFDVGASRDGVGSVMTRRDAAMASCILQAINRDDSRKFVILTGDVHASKAERFPWDPEYRSMGRLLADELEFISLKALYGGGSAWVCRATCGVTEVKDVFQPGQQHEFTIRLGVPMELPELMKFDGALIVERVTAAFPAVQPVTSK